MVAPASSPTVYCRLESSAVSSCHCFLYSVFLLVCVAVFSGRNSENGKDGGQIMGDTKRGRQKETEG